MLGVVSSLVFRQGTTTTRAKHINSPRFHPVCPRLGYVLGSGLLTFLYHVFNLDKPSFPPPLLCKESFSAVLFCGGNDWRHLLNRDSQTYSVSLTPPALVCPT